MKQSPTLLLTRSITVIALVTIFALLALDRAQVFGTALRATANGLFAWAIVLGGVALLLGAINVAWVHLRRVQAGAPDWIGSLALLVTLFVVLAAGLVDPAGTANPLVEWLFDAIIAPGQATLFALLVFFMAAAAYRYLRIGRPGGAWLLAGALLMMFSQLPAASGWLPTGVADFTVWLLEQPGMAALRGALLGSSLALALVGLRMIVGRR